MKKNIIFPIGILSSIIFLALVFKGVRLEEIKHVFSGGDYRWVIPAVLILIPIYFLRALRWRILLSPIKECYLMDLTSSIFIGFMINNTLPLRIGEFARAYVIGRRTGISKSSAFATVVVERTFDGLALIFLFLIIFFFYSLVNRTRYLYTLGGTGILLFIGLFIFILLLLQRKEKTVAIIRKAASTISVKAGEKITGLLNSFLQGLEVIKDSRLYVPAGTISVMIWLLDALGYYYFSKVFGLGITYPMAVFMMTIACIGVAIPAAPGYIGTFEAFIKFSLMLFAVSEDKAVAFAFLIHYTHYVFIFLAGLLFLYREGISFKEIKKNI